MQLFPERVQKLWNGWELRVLVLLSLSLQVVLIILGNKRKHIFRPWIRILVWSTYMSADWVATVSIGVLANNQGDSNGKSIYQNQVMTAFWAPFLLLHLGGPDTITAYSLEDNELWLRRMLELVVQVGLACYVLLKSWARTPFNFLSIPIFVAGIIKYGERIWVLRSASRNNFIDSLHLSSGHQEQSQDEEIEDLSISTRTLKSCIGEAYFLYNNQFRRLYVNLNLSKKDQEYSSAVISEMGAKKAFKVVAMELSFMYDALYTKATLVHSLPGVMLRCTTFFSTISTLVIFCFLINKHECSNIDTAITYSLLFGALCLETYALIMFILSDWSIIWLSEKKNSISQAITSFQSAVMSGQRWSRCIRHKNFIDYCLRSKRNYDEGRRFLDWDQFLEEYWYTSGERVDEIEEPIFNYLEGMAKNASDLSNLVNFLKQRGDYVIKKFGMMEEFGWSISGSKFDESIVLWHIATGLYAHIVRFKHVDLDEEVKALSKISKHLSEYMFYLLVMRPFMMPKGIGIEESKFRLTCEDAKIIFQECGIHKSNRYRAYKLLVRSTRVRRRDQSMLWDARMLATKLKSWEESEKRKWEMITGVWIEMLCYAASHCEWIPHGHQLRRGGEFLTHVYLLMSHLGITQQFQIFRDQFSDQYKDKRVIASLATRAAANDAREAASVACKAAQRGAFQAAAKSLYAGAAHALIVAAYADSIADAAIDAARAIARFIDNSAFSMAAGACDSAKDAVSNTSRPDPENAEAAPATRLVDTTHAAMKQAAIAIAQIHIKMDPNSIQDPRNPASQAISVAAADAREATRLARKAAQFIRQDLPANIAFHIAHQVDIIATFTDDVAAHAEAAANALTNAAHQLDEVAMAAHALREKLDAMNKAADEVSNLGINTTGDYYHEVIVATGRAVSAARVAWKAAAITVAKSQIQRNHRRPLLTASSAAQIAAYDVVEAAFASRIAAYNVRQVISADGIAHEIAEIAEIAEAAARGADLVADLINSAADDARTNIHALANLSFAIENMIDYINEAARDVAAKAHRFPTDTTADYYHRVNVTTARLADAANAAYAAVKATISVSSDDMV